MKNGYRGQEWIYYCDDDRGRIKIGYSLYPWGRVAEFKTVNPEIQMLVCESGERELERIRHEQFEEERIGGEWFCKSERLEEWIDFLRVTAHIETNLSGGTCAGGRKACCKTSATHTGSETQADQSAQTSSQAKFDKVAYQREYMRRYRAKQQEEK